MKVKKHVACHHPFGLGPTGDCESDTGAQILQFLGWESSEARGEKSRDEAEGAQSPEPSTTLTKSPQTDRPADGHQLHGIGPTRINASRNPLVYLRENCHVGDPARQGGRGPQSTHLNGGEIANYRGQEGRHKQKNAGARIASLKSSRGLSIKASGGEELSPPSQLRFAALATLTSCNSPGAEGWLGFLARDW